ncbi:MAG TPA: hypothetical protein VNG33_06950 [Polyangiaceae bacterium]|nr:hypothetical protein [Polyangiaceae bacterium]
MSRAPYHQSWFRVSSLGAVVTLLALVLTAGCGETVTVGLDDALTLGGSGGAPSAGTGGSLQLGGTVSGTTAEGGAAGGTVAPACVPTRCRGTFYQCGDCVDNGDGDGLIDALDPDCLGPCDDDETGLSTGLPTQATVCKQDCYFDGDNGPGNDKCEWSHQCDELSVAPDYPPSLDPRCKYNPMPMGLDCAALETTQQQACLDACLPVVPNGCDCFGCCELPRGSGEYHFIGVGRAELGCQRGNFDDPVTCPRCTYVPSCFNDCATCETCAGGPPTDATCDPDKACPQGERACGPGAPCDPGDYCVTGCCVLAPPPR